MIYVAIVDLRST